MRKLLLLRVLEEEERFLGPRLDGAADALLGSLLKPFFGMEELLSILSNLTNCNCWSIDRILTS